MIKSIEEFREIWNAESQLTQRLMNALTDGSLSRPVAEGYRTLGRIAWHIAQTIPEMGARTGLSLEGAGEHDPVPSEAAAVATAYVLASRSLLEQVCSEWTDETLAVEDDMYGMSWKRGQSLAVLLSHEIHHRAQMTVLMRQAGLEVPGIYGPARQDWATLGMEPPAV